MTGNKRVGLEAIFTVGAALAAQRRLKSPPHHYFVRVLNIIISAKKPILAGFPLLALWITMLGNAVAVADDKDIHEDEVKAAFVYNFAKFVEWPKDSIGAQINLCILGESPLGFSALKAIDGRTAQDKQLVTKLLNKPDELNGCQIVFIAASEHNKMAQLLKLAHRQHALTVSDMDGFAKSGSIGLVKTDEKIRFEINLLAAKDAGLTVSSRLLSLALAVYDENNKPEQ